MTKRGNIWNAFGNRDCMKTIARFLFGLIISFGTVQAQTPELIAKADSSFYDGDFAQIISACDLAIAEYPDTAFLYYYRGFALSNLGKYQAAMLDFDQAIDLEPIFAEPFLERARAKYEMGFRDKAYKDIRAALKRDGNLPEAYMLRAEMYLDEEIPDLAWPDLEFARRLLPKNPEIYCLKAEYYLMLGNTKSAVKESNLAIKMAPQDALGYVSRSQVFMAMGELMAARADIDQAITLEPLQFSLLNSRAMVLDALGDRKAAIKDLERYISKDSLAWDAYLTRAWFSMQDSLWDEAETDLAMAKTIRSEELTIEDQLGYLLVLKNDFPRAITVLTAVIEKMPNNAIARANLGYAKLKIGNAEDGLKDIQRAIKMDDLEPRSYLYRAECWHVLKKPVKACEDIELAKELGFVDFYGEAEWLALKAKACD